MTVSTSALIGMSLVIVAFAGPIAEYTDEAARQLHTPSMYIETLQTPMVGQEVAQ